MGETERPRPVGGPPHADPSTEPIADSPAPPTTPAEPPPLDRAETRQLDVIRRFGTVGALLLAAGSLGAAASPVFNPLTTVPVLGLFSRMPTVALALAFAGMAMIVLGWLWVARFARPGRPRMVSRGQVRRIMLTWSVPLLFVPPMFSRDVYSYLAQSKIAALGLNPYKLGPATALGVADPLTRGVPTIWRDTPAPYGPLFITIGRAVTFLSGNHVVTGVYLQRLLELIGIALIVWAVPRLAQRCGVPKVSALWLGVANPLVLWHLVIGSHNEALMIGLMLAGFELALRRMPRVGPGMPVPPVTRPELLWLLAGASVITLGTAVKFSAAPALGFLAVLVARRWGAKPRHLVAASVLLLAVFGVITVAISMGTGLGFGWIGALGTNGVVKSWESPMTGVGLLAGSVGILFGVGNHTDSTIAIMRTIGELATVVITVKLLWDTWKGRLQPMLGLGLCLGVVVILGATVQAWYLLWASIPLAIGLGESRLRTFTVWLSAVVAMILPSTGGSFDGHTYTLPDAYVAAATVLAIAVFLVRKSVPLLPWRDPSPHDVPEVETQTGPGEGVTRPTA
ncbi:MAG TPA: polyprenol phosphomannose-dependent alpha 1,6 mannosyltransferase MptB [Pseudonocardiaceae bacterium]|jgi:alpha-1,6-mannosyltransferase|nr:polyprenol phosphomannose-dependent alpha 1,6 mannosyltransferase MptB [Pseudonocardiaceae bacterium]